MGNILTVKQVATPAAQPRILPWWERGNDWLYRKDDWDARQRARREGLQWSWRSNQWMTPAALVAESRVAELAYYDAMRRRAEWSAFCESQWRYWDAQERAGR